VNVFACPTPDCPVVLFEDTVDLTCPVCGALPVEGPRDWAVRASKPGKESLLLPTPTRGQAETTAATINQDDTDATAVVVSRPSVGWST
jgi:hypothetical protein